MESVGKTNGSGKIDHIYQNLYKNEGQENVKVRTFVDRKTNQVGAIAIRSFVDNLRFFFGYKIRSRYATKDAHTLIRGQLTEALKEARQDSQKSVETLEKASWLTDQFLEPSVVEAYRQFAKTFPAAEPAAPLRVRKSSPTPNQLIESLETVATSFTREIAQIQTDPEANANLDALVTEAVALQGQLYQMHGDRATSEQLKARTIIQKMADQAEAAAIAAEASVAQHPAQIRKLNSDLKHESERGNQLLKETRKAYGEAWDAVFYHTGDPAAAKALLERRTQELENAVDNFHNQKAARLQADIQSLSEELASAHTKQQTLSNLATRLKA